MNRLYAPTRALPAIAAALALSSTSALAQEAQPATTPPPATAQPAPAPDPAPATDSSTAAPASDTSTQATATPAKRPVKRTIRTAKIAAAKPAPAPVRTATRTVTKHAAVAAATPKPAPAAAPKPIAAAAPKPAPVVALKPAAAPARRPAATPVAKLIANPPPPGTAAAELAKMANDNLPIVAGGALALLAIAGMATAIGRRRRRREQEAADEQTMAFEPFESAAASDATIDEEQPATAEPSAFAWGNQAQPEPAAGQDDRRPGESWVERAYRGPSPSNPSASLRNRLSRAAFFDKREREAAAGLAEPVDGTAGLPEAMVEEQEREPA